MQRSDAADLRRVGYLAEWHDVLEPGVRRRCVHWGLRPGCDALQRQQRGNVLLGRRMGEQYGLRVVGVRQRCVHGRVRSWFDSMLGQRRANVLVERHLGLDGRVRREHANLYERRVCELSGG